MFVGIRSIHKSSPFHHNQHDPLSSYIDNLCRTSPHKTPGEGEKGRVGLALCYTLHTSCWPVSLLDNNLVFQRTTSHCTTTTAIFVTTHCLHYGTSALLIFQQHRSSDLHDHHYTITSHAVIFHITITESRLHCYNLHTPPILHTTTVHSTAPTTKILLTTTSNISRFHKLKHNWYTLTQHCHKPPHTTIYTRPYSYSTITYDYISTYVPSNRPALHCIAPGSCTISPSRLRSPHRCTSVRYIAPQHLPPCLPIDSSFTKHDHLPVVFTTNIQLYPALVFLSLLSTRLS
ncbi:hypothetical protein Pmani_030968 [Petrolisthes manimaculis]|uniref:Uncharacterized protein n=1 Tax=Petrolisthes manimaculis TaxID=1843537 RepID=A0AAE1NVK8_9EUCA|nr:hypothetical protein Pmani_030968 [Petrolisthes manimaculis]